MNDKIKAAAAAKRTMVIGVVSGALIALYGLVISREHITEVGHAIGLNKLEAETLFVFVDFIALYGKMLTSKRLAAKTRRIGYRFLVFGGLASLACNVVAGFLHGKIGAAGYGAFIVGIVAALEYAIANTKAKTTSTAPAEPRTRKTSAAAEAPKATTKRCEPGCTCGKHRPRKNTTVDAIVRTPKSPAAASAPLSPAGAYAN